MSELTVTNREILTGAKALPHVSTTDALVSVKLARLRRTLAAEAAAIAEAFGEICARYAKRDAEQIVPDVDEHGAQKVWQITGTPAIVIADEHKAAHLAETNALLAGSGVVKLIPLTERDLASITIAPAHTALVGDGLVPFTEAAA